MINILIADDNIYYAKTLMDYINYSSNDIKVSNICINGKETFQLLNDRENIDLILLDYKMPIYTGIEVLRMLSDEKKKNMKILVLLLLVIIIFPFKLFKIIELFINSYIKHYLYQKFL